jgi:hypothetical protein
MELPSTGFDTGLGVVLQASYDAQSACIVEQVILPSWKHCSPIGAQLGLEAEQSSDGFRCRFESGDWLSFPTAERTVDWLQGAVHLKLAQITPAHTFIHAGVVEWRGKAILIPGPSHRGKSTLVQALVRSGARFYSDEYAVLDAAGTISSYPRSMMLRQTDGSERRIAAYDLGWSSDFGPLRAGAILATSFDLKAHWEPARGLVGESVLECLSNTVSARLQPERDLAAVCRMVSEAFFFRSPRGEAEPTARAVLGELDLRFK